MTKNGAYNSYLDDVEGDGDLDFFRYEGHEDKFYELWINQINKKVVLKTKLIGIFYRE